MSLHPVLSALLSLPRQGLIALVRGYRFFVSPWLGRSCRFEPSCSAYALQALTQHGAAAGSYLAAARVLRCHPLCRGGHDPVPAQPPRIFSIGCSGRKGLCPSPKKDVS
jgi:putative membrane protein insertion efficiency factor